MSSLSEDLNDYGIVAADGLYDADEVAAINAILDPHFAGLTDRARSYAYANDMDRLGVLDHVLSERVLRSLYEVIAEPVFYHLHCYEIVGGQSKAHIFGNELRGWHRDPDSDYRDERPSHVSLFLHLTDVGAEDGAFQFMPHTATRRFENRVPACDMLGQAGTSYYWNRHFFHRASPNRGPVRRRMMKLSIQDRRWKSSSLALEHLAPVAEKMKAAEPRRAALFGHRDAAIPAAAPASSGVAYRRVPANMAVDIGVGPLLRSKLKVLLKGEPKPETVAYEA